MPSDNGAQMREPRVGAVEEILARCLTEPVFLQSLIENREAALRGYRLDPRTREEIEHTDFQRLRQFSGFIGKVQHNFLWDFFPATRRLLRHYNIELEVFTGYRPTQLTGDPRNRRQADKIRRFLAYLADYAAAHPQYAALASVARYEQIAWELGERAGSQAVVAGIALRDAAGLPWARFLRLVPTLSGPLHIEAFDCDPSRVAASVIGGTFSPPHASATRLFAFLLDANAKTLRTFEIERLPALLLAAIDGKRRIASIIRTARRRALSAVPPRAFRALFEEAAEAGFIKFVERDECA